MTDDIEYNKLRAEVRCIEGMLLKARTPEAQKKLSQRLKAAKAAAHQRMLTVNNERRVAREAAMQTADRTLIDVMGQRIGHTVVARFADEARGAAPRQVPLKHRLRAAWVIITGRTVGEWL